MVQPAGFVALTIAPCRPPPTECVGVTEISPRPTASSPARYSAKDRAPAMQPTKLPRSARSSGDRASSATTSLMPMRPPGLQHTRDLAEDRGLVRREVDDAVADDDVDRGVAERDRFDPALAELDVRRAGLGRVVARELQHLVGHVEPVGEPGRADPRGRQQHVDSAAGTQVQDDLAGARRLGYTHDYIIL